MTANDPSVKIDRFIGLRNTERPARLPPGSLVEAVNVDIDDSGGIETRDGYQLVGTISNLTAAYATRDQETLYVVSGGQLLRVDSVSPAVYELLATGIPSGDIQWAEAGDTVFYAGVAQGMIRHDGAWAPLGVPTPAAPLLTEREGSLPAGRYLVTCTLKDSFGREGGAPPPSEIELLEDGGIEIAFNGTAGYSTILYVSSVDGDALYRLVETDLENWLYLEPELLTSPLDKEQQAAYPPPESSSHIAFWQGRLFLPVYLAAQRQTFVYFSRPYFWHLFDLAGDWFPVPGRLRMMIDTPTALIIGTDSSIYAYNGDTLAELADYGVPNGHHADLDGDRAYFWSNRGICRAMPFENLMDDEYSAPAGDSVCGAVIERDGRKKFVAVVRNPSIANNPY